MFDIGKWWDGVVSFWSDPTGHGKDEELTANEDKVNSAVGNLNDLCSSVIDSARQETISAMAELKAACQNVTGVNINENQFDYVYDGLESEVKNMSGLLQSNFDDIKAYSEAKNNPLGWLAIGAATGGMVLSKVGEGFFGTLEDLGDGALSLLGGAVGAVGDLDESLFGAKNNLFQNIRDGIGDFVKTDHVGDFASWTRDITGINRYSAITEDSALATAFEVAGNVGGYIATGGAISGALKGASLFSKSSGLATKAGQALTSKASITTLSNAGVATVGGVGIGTQAGLREGKNLNQALAEDGLTEGAKEGALMFGFGKFGEALNKHSAVKAATGRVNKATEAETAAKAEVERAKAIEKRKAVPTEKVLSCSYTKLAEPDGTDFILKRDFTFKDNKLTKEVKSFILSPTQGNPYGEVGVQNYLVALQPYLVQMSGYELMVERDKTTGVATTTTTINYEILDVTKVPGMHQSNFRFNVEYNKDVDQIKLEEDLKAKGYICK